MKRILSVVLIITTILSLSLVFSSCQSNNAGETDTQSVANTDSKTPLADALEEQAKDGKLTSTSAWLMYSWITKNIKSFKNPASVELTGNAYYCKVGDSTDFKFFLVEFRADNSFGGKSVGYAKVTATSIVETDWNPPQISPTFEGEQVWKCSTMFMEDAFNEFMTNNYK